MALVDTQLFEARRRLMLKIRVVGRGCKLCVQILAVVQRVVNAFDIDASIRKVTAPAEIEKHNLGALPGLVINDRVMCEGRVPLEGEVTGWIWDELESQ